MYTCLPYAAEQIEYTLAFGLSTTSVTNALPGRVERDEAVVESSVMTSPVDSNVGTEVRIVL